MRRHGVRVQTANRKIGHRAAELAPSYRASATRNIAKRLSSCSGSLARMKTPAEIEAIWLDYVLELANEARADPTREATTVVIGIHPFVVGTPDGAAALRRVLSRLKKEESVWLTDTEALLKAPGLK